jgi:hypothetical protein
MSLEDIITINITKATATVSRVGFGTPMILSNEADSVFADGIRSQTYTSIAGMTTAGFSATGTTVAAATAFFAQSPKVASVIVGRRENLTDMKIVCTVNNVYNSTKYICEINGTDFGFTSDATATNLEIATGIVALITAGAEPVTATDNADGTFDIEADVAGEIFTLLLDRDQITQDDETVDAGIVADLTAVRTSLTGSDDWYVVVTDSHATLETVALAVHIETLLKFFVVSSADDDIPAGTVGNLALTLQAADYARTSLIFHPKPHTFPEAAWSGSLLPLDPGSATWKFQTLTGVDFTVFTPTETSNLQTASCNYYIRDAGNSYTTEGYTASGEYNDVTRFIDWMTQRMKENIFLALINANKLAFTDQGIGVITNEIWGVLRKGQSQNGIAEDPEPTVVAPDAIDVSSADRAARTLDDVTFTCRLAGAIHTLDIDGTVTV